MATPNPPKKRRKQPHEYRRCMLHVRMTPDERRRVGFQSDRLGWTMSSILLTALDFAERGGILARDVPDKAKEQAEGPAKKKDKDPAYPKPGELTESERIIMAVRRRIRAEKQKEEHERRYGY